MRAFTSFGDGHGVWEKDGGATLPFYARNFRDVTQWVAPVRAARADADACSQLQDNGFEQTRRPATGVNRRLPVTPDRIQSHGLDICRRRCSAGGDRPACGRPCARATPIPQRAAYGGSRKPRTRASLVQVTNLGITVKDSPQNTLVFVTRLDNGAPVAGANVSIVALDNTRLLARHDRRRTASRSRRTRRCAIPTTGGSSRSSSRRRRTATSPTSAATGTKASSPWEFGTGVNLHEAAPLLRGTVFTDRGVYRLGEEVHFKAILRHNTPAGVRLLPAGTPVVITVRDSQNRRRRRAHGEVERVEQRRMDDDAAAGRGARQLLAARDARKRPAEAEDAGSAAARCRAGPKRTTSSSATRSPCTARFWSRRTGVRISAWT